MNKKTLAFKIYFCVTLILLAFTVAMRIAACLSDMNYVSGYFDDKTLINVADNTLIIAVALALSYAFAEPKGKKLVFNFSSPLNYVFAGCVSIALLFFARHAFSLFKTYKLYVDEYEGRFFYNVTTEKILMYIALALGALAVLSVLHFVLASLVTGTKDTRRADFGLITVLFLSLYAAYLYFSNELPINAPAKIIDQSAYLASALFFLFETRISIGRERWRAYRAFGLIALLLCTYSSIPSLIVYIADGAVISNSIYETLLTISLSLFIGARLVLTAILNDAEEAKTVSLIKAAFLQREAEINPAEEKHYEPETDEDLEGMTLDDRGEYYELIFDAEEDVEEEKETESGTNEENSGN